MSFFMNPFPQEFRGSMLLDDRQHILTFDCPPNAGRGLNEARTWGEPNWDLSGTDGDGVNRNLLTISFALDSDFMTFVDLPINIGAGAADLTAVKPAEVMTTLNTNVSFSTNFAAQLSDNLTFLRIRSKKGTERIRWFIKRSGAETVVQLNKMAGVKELPVYFSRHTVDNRYAFADCTAMLIALDPAGSTVDAAIIDNAVDNKGKSKGFDSGTIQEDYELLRGRSQAFMFQKNTVDGSNRVTEIIEYPAGAAVGDLAKKTTYTYTGGNTAPDQVTEFPYTLTVGDLVSP